MTKRTIQIQIFFLLNVQNWIGNHKLDYKLFCVTLHQSLLLKNCKKSHLLRVFDFFEIGIYRKRAIATEPLKIDQNFKKQKCVELNYEQLCRWMFAIRETCLELFFQSMLQNFFFGLSQVWCLSSPSFHNIYLKTVDILLGLFKTNILVQNSYFYLF